MFKICILILILLCIDTKLEISLPLTRGCYCIKNGNHLITYKYVILLLHNIYCLIAIHKTISAPVMAIEKIGYYKAKYFEVLHVRKTGI